MTTVAATDAREHLARLIQNADWSEEVVIVNRGEPLARLAPPNAGHDVERAREAIRRMRARARRWGIRATPEEIKSWIEDGRP
jgi:prevent-host-death family protein